MPVHDMAAILPHRARIPIGGLIASTLLVAASLSSSALAQGPVDEISAGSDPYETIEARFDLEQILPVGFFGSGCSPSSGPIDLIGEPVDSSVFGDTDTLIRRLSNADVPVGSTGSIDIELAALNLVSMDPVTVSCSDLTTQLWELRLTNSPSAPPSSGNTMEIFRATDEGGFFAVHLDFSPLSTFNRIGDTEVLTFDSAGEGSTPIALVGSSAWTITCPEALQTPETTPNFCPGGLLLDPFVLFSITGAFDTFLQRTPASLSDGDVSVAFSVTTDPPDAPDSFEFTFEGGPDDFSQSFFLTGASTPFTIDSLLAGDYSVTVVPPEDWDSTDAACSGGADEDPLDGLELNPGEAVNCSFSAAKQSEIRVKKVTNPPGEPDVFNFRLVAVPLNVDQNFSLGDGSQPHSSGALKPGNYLLEEIPAPAKWKRQPDIACEGASDFSISMGQVLIRLKAAEVVTCTFINTQRSTVTIAKAVPGEDPQDFEFESVLFPTGIVLDDDPTSGTPPRSRTFTVDPRGDPIKVAEVIPDGWKLEDIVCIDPDGGTTVDVAAGTAAIDTDPGESVRCTFVNVKKTAKVAIDIEPGGEPNSINCRRQRGVIPVAILTSPGFDATAVDHTTVVFEGAREVHMDNATGQPQRHEQDVDGDGDIDLVLHFLVGDTGLTCGSTEGVLTGTTFDGDSIEGRDAVHIVGD